MLGWIKINTDGVTNGTSGLAGCGSIFKTYRGFCNGCFSKPLGIMNAYEAELLGFITALEFAQHYSLSHLWLECDSSYMV